MFARLLAGATLVMALVACPSSTTGSVLDVTIDGGDRTITEGASVTLTATVATAGTTIDTVAWSSSDVDVGTIDDADHVTGHTAGTTIITAAHR